MPPEGASAILHRSTAHAPQLARQQRIGAAELLRQGTVQRLVPEPVPASVDPAGFLGRLTRILSKELAALCASDGQSAD